MEQNEKPNTIEQFYGILDLVLKFDLRDNPNGGTSSLGTSCLLKTKTKRWNCSDTGWWNCCETSLTSVSYYVCGLIPGKL